MLPDHILCSHLNTSWCKLPPNFICNFSWLKEIIGFVLNKIDSGDLDRELLIAKVTSLVQSPFALSRYRTLKVSDFTDDITTINANELLMGAAGGGVGPLNEFGGGAEANEQQNVLAGQ